MQLCPYIMKTRQPKQHWEELRYLPHLLAQLQRSRIGLFDFWRGMTFSNDQCGTQRSLQCKFLLSTLGSIRQRLEECQSFSKVPDRLDVSRALGSFLPCLLPIGNSLSNESSLGV